MRLLHRAAAGLLVGGTLAGTWADWRQVTARNTDHTVLAADFHVHGYPVDGTLPRWELQREAARRGLDVIAVTNHNQTMAGRLGRFLSGADVIAIPGQELTTPRFHMIAAGISHTIDWRLPAGAAITEIHRQGGVAIAAHPVIDSWRPADEGALRALDGVEVAHPVVDETATGRSELAVFYERVRAVNPDAAPIGSSDHHFIPDMGKYRTYLLVKERSETGVLDAIRTGRTVASDAGGALTGDPALTEAVRRHLEASGTRSSDLFQRTVASAVLLALAALMLVRHRR